MSPDQKLEQAMDLNLHLNAQRQSLQQQCDMLTGFIRDLDTLVNPPAPNEQPRNSFNLQDIARGVGELKKAARELEELKSKPAAPKRPGKPTKKS